MFQEFGWAHILALLRGAVLTIWVCLLATLFGCIIGLFVGLGKQAKNKVIRAICSIYVNLLRGIPLLIILFFIYYAIPIVFNVQVSQAVCSIVGLSIYAGAYIGEIVHGAITSLPKGQFEACDALGMSTVQKYSLVIIPQAFRAMIPSLVTFIIGLIKDSSLVSVIGYVDLTRAGKIVSNLTMQPFITFICVGIIYFILCYPLSILADRLVARMSTNGR